ncbi:MAG TPA: hypothetical protein VFV49_04890 [Thermoanaerobaculia bacterium]|nr:hypothetical protein [Thermoanaerobaculia bacterium]
MHARLSVKQKNGRLIDLPQVELDGRPCIAASGGVPGCHDTKWP